MWRNHVSLLLITLWVGDFDRMGASYDAFINVGVCSENFADSMVEVRAQEFGVS